MHDTSQYNGLFWSKLDFLHGKYLALKWHNGFLPSKGNYVRPASAAINLRVESALKCQVKYKNGLKSKMLIKRASVW